MHGGGRKRGQLSTKVERGTVRPYRDLPPGLAIAGGGNEGGDDGFISPNELPKRPDWLTPAGEEVWMDDIGRVAAGRLSGEADATMFGNYCNLQGAIIQAWRALAKGVPGAKAPPPTALSEVRKLQEMLGIAGVKSRIVKGAPTGGGSQASGNPFRNYR
jgi:hypothetical protein